MPDLAFLQDNPYLAAGFQVAPPNKWSTIGSALAAMGSGISHAGMAGQPWMAGVGPGAEIATNDGIPGLGGFQAPPGPMMGPGAGGGVNPNNVGNVRPVRSSTGFQQSPGFDSGVALTVNNAPAKAFNQDQPMTLMQIADHWAPKGDGNNDPKAWAFNVARFSPLNPDGSVNQSDISGQTAVKRAQSAADELASMDDTPELKQPIDATSAVDRANFKAALAKGDEKGAAAILTKAQSGRPIEELHGDAFLQKDGPPAGKFLDNDLGPAVRSTLGAPDATRRMQALRMSVGGNPEAVQGLQKAILDDFRGAAQSTVAEDSTGAPRLLANGAAKWLESNKGAVANVLSPDQVAGLEAITRALKDQAQTAVKIAGSDTNRNLATMSILEASLWKGAGDAAWLAPVRQALNPVYSGANDKAPERLTEVLLDPKVAAALMKKATPANVKMAEPVLTSIGHGATLPAEKERQ